MLFQDDLSSSIDLPPVPPVFSLYITDIDDIAEGVSGVITGTAGVHVSHMLYADDLTLLTNEPVILCKPC